MKVYVVIPTLDRLFKLNRTIFQLNHQTYKVDEIVIVDSSQNGSILDISEILVKYLRTPIKSSSYQRNLGINYLKSKLQDEDVVIFLDDDLVIPPDYVEDLKQGITKGYNGISGVALNPYYQRTFIYFIRNLLDYILSIKTLKFGAITRSGFANPINFRNLGQDIYLPVEWLIGCAAWKWEVIKDHKFNEELTGYSLGEDVIYSTKIFQKFGKLVVNPKIIFLNDNKNFDIGIVEDYYNKINLMRKAVIENMNYRKKSMSFMFVSLVLEILKKISKKKLAK